MWFAFKLVSLNHWIQLADGNDGTDGVVICFQISIFEPLNTAYPGHSKRHNPLWFAFKLVSLNHWIQHEVHNTELRTVVICFQISIFEPLNTARFCKGGNTAGLWFAFKLVSLNHWIQLPTKNGNRTVSCDLLSN